MQLEARLVLQVAGAFIFLVLITLLSKGCLGFSFLDDEDCDDGFSLNCCYCYYY